MKNKLKQWKRQLLLCMGVLTFSLTFAQSGRGVTGNVKDATGEVLIGVSIKEKNNETNGTVTDVDGNFQINVPADAVLMFSYVGFSPQEVAVAGKTNLQVVMAEDTEMLNEIVVIGYGGVRKSDLTGSVIAIKVDEINRGAVTSPQQLIQGKIPGVFVRPGNGQPGSGSTMRIRSGASLNASNDPLIVIDGVPVGNDAAPGMSNPLAAINPNDIETFTVLKDASATAIYGSRASNGVILVTTKRGGDEKIKISYNSTYSISDPSKKVKTLSPTDFRSVVSEVFGSNQTVMDLLNMYPDQNTNWQDEIFRTAFATDQNISLSGTTLDTPYRISFGYNNEDGTLKTSNFERYTLDLSLNHKFFDQHLDVKLNVKGSINNNEFANTGSVGSAAFYDPTKPVYNDTGDFNGYWNWTANGAPNTQSGSNPVESLLDRFDSGKTERSLGNIQLDYKVHFLPELHLNLNLGYDVATGDGDKGPNIGSFDALKDGTFPGVGTRTYWENFRRNQLLEYYMNYEKELPQIKSRFNIMGGYSWQNFYYSNYERPYSVFDPGTSVPDITGWDKDEADGMYIKQGSRKIPGESYMISFFGRLNYTFMDNYLLTATVRRDGSSKFSEDHRWGTFPSVALAWNIKNESFMQEVNVLSNLKLRLGYGVTGQQDLSDYQFIKNYVIGSDPASLYLGEFLMKPSKYNSDLKWESTTTYNIGIDYGFLNNRINGSIEYYKKKTKDLLSVVSVPAGSNFSNLIFTNIGNMNNDGIEFNINAAIIDTKDFSWNAGFNFTWNTSKVTKLVQSADDGFTGTDAGNEAQRHMIGYTPYTYYLFQQVYDENGLPIQNAFVDRNGDGQITDADRYFLHSPMPEYYMGFSSQFTYKQFDLGFNMRANIGNYSYNELAASNSTSANAYSGMGFLNNLHEAIYDTKFTLSNSSEQKLSDHFLEDASFLKMDNITLGYSFRNLFSTKVSGRLSFSVQNVFTITKYKGLDPENAGVDNDLWPRPQVYTLGVNLNF
ncbi:MAG: TonB-dependent receptor [Prevotella sp.]|jgi:iron complex outermembrane receptor protein|nr:TonB-dependent receptor [Prevotella sp.]